MRHVYQPGSRKASPPASAQATAPPHDFAKALGLGVLAYSLFRVAVVTVTFDGYGLNPRTFALIELTTAYPYGVLLARMLRKLSAGAFRSSVLPGAGALVLLLAPYAYVLAATSRVPAMPAMGLYAVLTVALGSLVVGVVRTVRQSRSQLEASQ